MRDFVQLSWKTWEMDSISKSYRSMALFRPVEYLTHDTMWYLSITEKERMRSGLNVNPEEMYQSLKSMSIFSFFLSN